MSRDRTELASASEEAKRVIKLLPAASAPPFGCSLMKKLSTLSATVPATTYTLSKRLEQTDGSASGIWAMSLAQVDRLSLLEKAKADSSQKG